MQVHVLPVGWETHSDVLREIRDEVFVKEQGVAQEIEWDGQDDVAHHFLAINEAGQRIGCARLLPTGQIGRMAVLPSHRTAGIGLQLLNLAVEHAKQLGFTSLFLNAQTHAEAFYRKAGFLKVGGEFMEAGIPHQRMEMVLPIPFEASQGLRKPVVRPELPHPAVDTGALCHHNGERECRDGLRMLLDYPRRHVRLYSQQLDHALLDDDALVAALSEFVRRGRPATLQVLIHNSDLIVSRGHRLLELARRLDSKIKIRLVPGELAHDRLSYLLADTTGFWMLPDYREYQGFSNHYDPVEASRLAERFDYLWERSREDAELRTQRL